MFTTFVIMLTIEVSLLATNSARVFATTVLTIGLILRGLACERELERAAEKLAAAAKAPSPAVAAAENARFHHRRSRLQARRWLPARCAGWARPWTSPSASEGTSPAIVSALHPRAAGVAA